MEGLATVSDSEEQLGTIKGLFTIGCVKDKVCKICLSN